MLNPVWIEAHVFYLGPRPAIVLGVDSVIQQKFRPTFRCVYFDRKHRRRPDQDSVSALFGDDERALFDTEATAELRWQHDCATSADLAG